MINTIDNYSSLQSTQVIADEIVWLKGYRSEQDGGEGYFIGVIDTINDDGGVIVSGPSPGTFWKRINFEHCRPEFWGAIRDGITDDSQAIQSAINYSAIYGKSCLLSFGNYAVYNTLNIGVGSEVRNITIKGLCRHRSKIIAQIPNNQPVINISNAYYTNLENFTINSNNSTGNCIDLKAPSAVGTWLPQYTKIYKINVNNFDGLGRKIDGNLTSCAAGIYAERDLNTIVTDFVSVGCDQGIIALYSQQPSFNNITLSTNLLGGLTLEMTESARISDGDIVGACDNAMYRTFTSGLDIDNGHVIVYATKKTTIRGCKFKNSLGREISLNYADGTTVRDCMIRMDTLQSTGIKNKGSNCVIDGNQFFFGQNCQTNIAIEIDMATWLDSFGNIVNNYFNFTSTTISADAVIKVIGATSSSRATKGNILNNNIITSGNTVLNNVIVLNSGSFGGLNINNNTCLSKDSGSLVGAFVVMANIQTTNYGSVIISNNHISTYNGGGYSSAPIIFPSDLVYSDKCKIEHNGVIKNILIDDISAQNVFGHADGMTYNTQDGGFVISDGSLWKKAKFI